MKKELAIAFVIYNPNEFFAERVQLLLDEDYYVYIYDNSNDYQMLNHMVSKNHIIYVTNKGNDGLGYGINNLAKRAYDDGFESLLFFDQDTGFNFETLRFIRKAYSENKDNFHNVAVINFNNLYNKSQELFKKTDLVINSGSLFILKNLEIMGWHDKTFFVDGVDYKFCVDAKIKKFEILSVTSTPGFDHISEQDDSDYKIFGKLYRFRKYSSFRVKDYIKSSIRLIMYAFKNKEFKYSYIFSKYLFYYIVVQSYVRCFELVTKRKKND